MEERIGSIDRRYVLELRLTEICANYQGIDAWYVWRCLETTSKERYLEHNCRMHVCSDFRKVQLAGVTTLRDISSGPDMLMERIGIGDRRFVLELRFDEGGLC